MDTRKGREIAPFMVGDPSENPVLVIHKDGISHLTPGQLTPTLHSLPSISAHCGPNLHPDTTRDSNP